MVSAALAVYSALAAYCLPTPYDTRVSSEQPGRPAQPVISTPPFGTDEAGRGAVGRGAAGRGVRQRSQNLVER